MPIETGRYFIINVQTRNRAFLPNADSEEPVQGRFKQDDLGEQWEVIKRDNGHHTIMNIGHKQYAASGNRSPAGAPVTGWENLQTWLIQKTTDEGQYTISTTNTKMFWSLADVEQGTPIVLADAPTNPFNWWMFKEVKTGNDAKVDQHLDTDTAAGDTALRAVYLLELAPPPAPLPEPFELDLVVIQEMPYNFKFIRNATETAHKICSPLFKSKHLDTSNLLIQVIEFEPFEEAYHFRSLGPDSFNELRRYRGEKLLWTVCSGPVIPLLLTKGMNDFQSRPSTTKVVVLNLRYIPLQNGGQERLRELIERMIDEDVILIVTLSEPHRSNTIFDADLFQELARLSSGTVLSFPADGSGFYPCIVDYLQNFDAESIVTKFSNVKTINPEIYSRQQQPERPDEPGIDNPYGTLKPEGIIEGTATQSSILFPSVASPSVKETKSEMNEDNAKIKRSSKIIKDEEQVMKIVRWLAAPDSSKNYNEARDKHQMGTCSWFLDGRRFRKFQDKADFLWITGKGKRSDRTRELAGLLNNFIAGCGKTILCSTIIDKIKKLRKENTSMTCAYFFFDGRDSREDLQLHDKLIRSLVLQLFDQCDDIPAPLRDLWDEHKYDQPSTKSLEDVLCHIINGMQSTYIIIDSLDECRGTEREKSLQWIKRLISESRPKPVGTLHMAVVSRPEPDIKKVLQPLDMCCVDFDLAKESTNHDITIYLEQQLSVLEKWDDDTRNTVKSKLIKNAEGMFRWVALQLMELKKYSSRSAVMKQLNRLPKGLYETYDRILSKIDNEHEHTDITTFLQWLCCSVRPMDLAEIAETITVDFNTGNGPQYTAAHRYWDKQDVLEKCAGLIIESEELQRRTVKLAHFSIKEYLFSEHLRTGSTSRIHLISEELCHSMISQTCLAYLMQFNTLFDTLDQVPESVSISSPLTRYAAMHWGLHATHAGGIDKSALESPILTLVTGLIAHRTIFLNWLHFLTCFERTGDLADTASAITTLQTAVDFTPEEDANMATLLSNLGTSLSSRFERTGGLADIASAISNHQRAVELTPEGDPYMPTSLSNLGSSFRMRFEHTGDLADIVIAISTQQRAVQLTLEGHASMPTLFSNLGTSFSSRFEHTGDLADIASAISTLQRAVELTPEGHASMPSRLSNLGSSFLSRFERTGDLADIASAISTQQRAVAFTPEGHASMPTLLSNLGTSFLSRFKRTGDLADIVSAISTQQRAVELTPEGHASMPSRLSSLGSSFLSRFKRTGDLADVASAISTQQWAVEFTPEGHANMPSHLSSLGSSFLSRFERTGDLADVASAISTQQWAVELTPEGHALMPSRLSNLGSSFLSRFERTGDLADIASAISTQQRAIELTPEGHVGMLTLLMDLGISSEKRFKTTHNIEHMHQTISIFRQSATQVAGDPSVRLNAARKWALYSREAADKSQSLQAFSVAIHLLPQVAGLEHTIHKRHQALVQVSDITASATAAAIDNNELEMAVTWLEQGRCLVWNQLNHLRTAADDLRVYNPSLADRFLHVAHALEVSGSRPERHATFSLENMTEMISLQDEAHTHVHLAKQWHELLQEIRSIPEFQGFLLPSQPSKLLSRLPLDGPIIIFNIHQSRCDALALLSGLDSPFHIPLDNFSLDDAIQLRDEMHKYLTYHHVISIHQKQGVHRYGYRVRHQGDITMYYVLRNLWEYVAKPILDALGYSPNDTNPPRIWWCPTGPLAFLPIHAAGIYPNEKGTAGPCVSDYVVSSYTPNINTLLDKITEAPNMDDIRSNMLIISQPSTPGQRPIPGAKREAHALNDMIGSSSLLLEDASATMSRVKEEMKSHRWVHFACHGIHDAAEPLKSGVLLYDGRLELLEMMKQTLPNAELAFLSAPQTSTGNQDLPDEVVHLAAGMLAAGYRSVVGTMWIIKDDFAVNITKDFYFNILDTNSEGRLDSGKAAGALHRATQNLRKELGDTEEALLTWVPYVHFGF